MNFWKCSGVVFFVTGTCVVARILLDLNDWYMDKKSDVDEQFAVIILLLALGLALLFCGIGLIGVTKRKLRPS